MGQIWVLSLNLIWLKNAHLLTLLGEKENEWRKYWRVSRSRNSSSNWNVALKIGYLNKISHNLYFPKSANLSVTCRNITSQLLNTLYSLNKWDIAYLYLFFPFWLCLLQILRSYCLGPFKAREKGNFSPSLTPVMWFAHSFSFSTRFNMVSSLLSWQNTAGHTVKLQISVHAS